MSAGPQASQPRADAAREAVAPGDRPLGVPELQRLNEALKQQIQAHHEELERLFSVSLDVMLSMDADGRLITVSPSFEAVVGVPAAQAQGEVFGRFLHPDELARTWEEVRRVLTGRHNAVDFETRVLRPDGAERVVSWRAVGSATEARLYAVGRDVTERKQAEQRLMRAQRLEAVGQLTGGIAHDFNNILGAMLSFLEVAKRQAGDASGQARTLESAIAAGRRGATLVRQLLTFARKQELALKPTDLNRLVRDMHDMLARTLGGTVELAFELAPSLPPALVDPTQLETVLLNLCINARDAMPDGGRLVIRTAAHAITEDTATRRDDLPVGDYVLLVVGDTGAGMDEATLARCFEPFYTTKDAGHGSGLGLSQVLGVVQQCGGMVKLESAPGRGTTIEVVLPRAAQDEAGHTEAAVGTAPPSLAAGTVLVVDDHADVLAATTQLLQAFGYDAIPAASAEEAMSIVLSARPFDVILTDHAMPGMTGAQLLRDAVRHRPHLVGLIVTGHADVTAVREMVPSVAVLRKPFEADQLAEAVEAAVSAHRLQTGEH
jgi:PAS domain S-box-containing protein